jgi:hypothetical protein
MEKLSRISSAFALTAILLIPTLSAWGRYASGSAQASDSYEAEGIQTSDPATPGEANFNIPGVGPTTVKYRNVNGLAVFEGDIVLGTVDQVKGRLRNATEDPDESHPDLGLGTSQPSAVQWGHAYRWEHALVPYQIDRAGFRADPDYASDFIEDIDEAIAHWEDNTNLHFVEGAPNEDGSFLLFRPPTSMEKQGCYTNIGRQPNGSPTVSILSSGCSLGNIKHEIGHAIGLWHEQSRIDRDEWVKVNKENIVEGYEDQFESYTVNGPIDKRGFDLGPYDYGSIMQYGEDFWGKPDPDNPGEKLITIEALQPLPAGVEMGQRDGLSPNDIAQVNKLYAFTESFGGGEDWGSDYYATSIAFGDVDGDGRDEVGVARYATDEGYPRYLLFDGSSGAELYSGGNEWGSPYYATSIAFGDVDGDNRDEVGVARYANDDGYPRYLVLSGASGDQLYSGGNEWGDGYFATAIAFGDVDGDGHDEIGITRKATDEGYPRYLVLDGATGAELYSGGNEWGGGYFATSIAFGDVDGDGRDEVGVGRYATDEGYPRYLMLDGASGDELYSGGTEWGDGYYATSIAFGDIDGDGRDEVGVARHATDEGYPRYLVLDGANGRQLYHGGENWGSEYFATGIAFGDIDGDGADEVGVARYAVGDGYPRYWILSPQTSGKLAPIYEGGHMWGSGYFATSIAFGDVMGKGLDSLGVTRKAGENERFVVESHV